MEPKVTIDLHAGDTILVLTGAGNLCHDLPFLSTFSMAQGYDICQAETPYSCSVFVPSSY